MSAQDKPKDAPAAGAGLKKTAKQIACENLNITGEEYESIMELAQYTQESAYGFTPSNAATIANLLVNMPVIPYKLIMGCMTAVGQIRENIAENDIMDDIGELLDLNITDKNNGKRETINFSAVKLIGDYFCAQLKDDMPIIKKLAEKAGLVWIGTGFPDTIAGKINKETREHHTEWEFVPFSKELREKLATNMNIIYTAKSGSYTDAEVSAIKSKVTDHMSKLGARSKN